ncbi:MAG: hypothetical protein KDE26_03985 [Bacteroidetes bacterium]|nr:hypothetical protein [Bacteroidota bacterium]MCB0842409.1 hypothetical protein [Bacteroidota bacterium]
MSHTNTILFLNANPDGDQKSRWEEEFREIQMAYERGAERKTFNLKSRWAVRISDLRRGLLDEEPRVLHISGRNEGEGIMFENNRGEAIPALPSALSDLLDLFKGQLEWVILSGCSSEVQALAISDNIPNVIGLDLESKARIEASVSIYDAIMAGKEDPRFVAKIALASAGLTSGEEGVFLFQQGEKVDLTVEQNGKSKPLPISTLPPPISERIEHIRTYFCDRTLQSQEFAQKLSSESHFYFFAIHGNDPQSHHGLFNRFYHHYLSDPDFPHQTLAHKIILRQASSLEAYKAEIRSKLLTHLNLGRLMRMPAEQQLSTIAKHLRQKQIHTLAVEFRVRSSYWKTFTPQLVEWFMQEYCQLQEPDVTLPVFYFFISVIYEDKTHHEIMIDQIRSMLPKLPGCVILSELMPVTREDIRDWIDNFITSNTQRQERLLLKYFPEKRDQFDMAEIELRLDAFINNEPPDNDKL